MVLILEEHKSNIQGPLPPLGFVKRFFGDRSLLLPSQIKAKVAELQPHFPYLFGSSPLCERPSEGHRKSILVCECLISVESSIDDHHEDSVLQYEWFSRR